MPPEDSESARAEFERGMLLMPVCLAVVLAAAKTEGSSGNHGSTSHRNQHEDAPQCQTHSSAFSGAAVSNCTLCDSKEAW